MNNLEDIMKGFGDREYFTLLIITVYSFTFVYSFLIDIIKRNNWYTNRILQRPRSKPNINLIRACLIKNIRNHFILLPIPQASEWAHPIEDIITNITPSLAGCFIMGSHLYVLLFWLFLRMWKTLDAHCGYNLPFPLSIWHGPGMMGCNMHDFHHESKEGMDSCFGAMTTFWDWICGTDRAFYEIKSS